MEAQTLRAELAVARAEADAALAASKQAHGAALRTVQQQADEQFAELEGALSAMEQQLAALQHVRRWTLQGRHRSRASSP